jgi:hypothetical protein
MIRTNLSTRPFYNERLVHAVLVLAAVVVVVVTVFNVSRSVTLSRRQAALDRMADAAEQNVEALRNEAVRLRRGVNAKELDTITGEAREANAIIDRRVFSWTELFNRFETTLPPNVRIAAVRPRVERDGNVTVVLAVVARQVEDIDAFIEKLEAAQAFSHLLAREEIVDETGMLRANLEGRYLAGPRSSGRGD